MVRLGQTIRSCEDLQVLLATLGGVRFLLALGFFSNYLRDLPPEQGAEVKAFLCSPKHTEATMKERNSIFDTMKQIGALGNLGSLPLTLIYSEQVGANKDATMAERVERQRRGWFDSSTNSRFLIIPGADHISVLTNKEHAKVLSHAVMDMLESLKR